MSLVLFLGGAPLSTDKKRKDGANYVKLKEPLPFSTVIAEADFMA